MREIEFVGFESLHDLDERVMNELIDMIFYQGDIPKEFEGILIVKLGVEYKHK